MKILFPLLLLVTAILPATAQNNSEKVLMRLPITDYITKANDSVTIVQVQLPDSSIFSIPDKSLGVLHHRYVAGKTLDTSMIGYGKCHLIKGNFYYFAIQLQKNQEVSGGDLLSFNTKLPDCRKSVLFDASRNHIEFTTVEDQPFYNWQQPFQWQDAGKEAVVFTKMVQDIRYTGKQMKVQMPESNQVVKGGIFDQQKLFDAMEKVSEKELLQFLNYIKARPSKYAGHTWKISEIFATWMVSETPVVKP